MQALLLEEREQARHQIQLQVILLRVLVEVKDLVVLAEAITVEVAVRVVEQRVLGIEVSKRRIAFDRLPEGGRVFEGESLLTDPVAKAHPRAVAAPRGAAMALVD